MRKIEAWYNKFCGEAFNMANDIEKVAAYAATKSYKASVAMALHENDNRVGFKDKKKESVDCRCKGEKLLKDFLLDAAKQQDEEELLKRIYATWDSLRKIYHDDEITWYTYGNAQKWVSIAIKYFIIVAAIKETTVNGKTIDTTHALCKTVFPVDSIMIGIIKKDFGIHGVKPTWSKCDDKQAFIDYIEAVKQCVGDSPVLEYEIEKWEQR